MNSKKKNKNRQNKAPNPTPPQKEEVSKPSSPLDVINPEIDSVVEERVPNIVSEKVAAEVNDPSHETPKKPKRNRGKKKKEDDKTAQEDDVKTEEPIPDSEIQPIKDTLDEANIAPTARKKKNKNKKGPGPVQDEKIEGSTINNDAQTVLTSGQPHKEVVQKEEPEQDMTSSKKKNKKKKNRNDSERSDKPEEVSCTSAFQKLLEEDVKVETIVQPSTDDSNVLETTVKEVAIESQPDISFDTKVKETLQKDEGNKNKKNTKKDKKQPAVQGVLEEQIQFSEMSAAKNLGIPSNVSSEVIVKETSEHHEVATPSSSTADDNSLNHKAKIAKPVDKKKKGSEDLEKPVSEPKVANLEDMAAILIEGTHEAAVSEVLPTDDLNDMILVPLTEITPDWHEEVKKEEGNGPVISCEDKNETSILQQPVRNREKNRNIKKSPYPPRPIEMPGRSDIPKVGSTHEETLSELSSSSKEKQEVKHDVKPDETVEIKVEKKAEHQENTMKNIEVSKDIEKRDKRKKSPKPSTLMGQSGIPKLGKVMPETSSKSSEHQEMLFEVKQEDKIESKPVTEAVPLKDKNAQIKISDNDKRNSKKKPPKAKNETAMSSQCDVVQTELTHIGETMLPTAISCFDIVTLKSEERTQIKPDLEVEKTESKQGEMERIKTPDSAKRQKRKKSPKPVELDVATSSKSVQGSNKNILNIEDIIIIQAEVVSDEKATQGEAFIACEDSTDKKDMKKLEAKHDSEKSKKRKKSPKPLQRDCTEKTKVNSERDCVLETQGEIQMPVTPVPQDMKLSPKILAVELETPKIDSVPSPSEVTPDFIEYPRCSSEQHDNNNNMVIQEISHPDPHLVVPIIIPETPLIQSANINSPELVIAESKKEEKTDLKSKVMEVNQDMEELRMSIEKSLAELTSLEKTGIDAEKNIKEQNRENLEKYKQIEVKHEIPRDSNPIVNLIDENKEVCVQAEEEKTCLGPVCPARKDPKGKGKSKKKGKQESTTQNTSSQPPVTVACTETSAQPQDKNKETNKSEQSSATKQGKEKQQKSETKENKDGDIMANENYRRNNQPDFEPIQNFEDAMTSSADDVNKTFEMLANEANPRLTGSQNNPEINVIAPQEDEKGRRQEKQNPVSPPKNLLGHPDIPVSSSRTDYKKEKNKPPNYKQAKVKIKDTNQVEIEMPEKSKGSSESKRKLINFKKPDESLCVTNQNDDYVYKYSFRKVFLQCSCHVCKKDLNQTRVPCSYCNLIFFCSQKHKDDDYSQHQALCFAVSTIVHLKDQKFMYADARSVTGHNYRLLRMQMIVSCEKVLKRRLTPWEQEALLYPRMCADVSCREWRQGKLVDCDGCGQISYCSEHPEHLPKSHSRWCKSYNLYRGLVKHQQTKGRLEPKLPTRVVDLSPLPDNINEVLAAMYEEKIEMSDTEYAALTQLATAPLTALFCLQFRPNTTNGLTKKSSLTLHIVGAELQFEADVLNKWEVFLLHLVPHVEELRAVLVGPDLNPSNLPLELLGKTKHCDHCQRNKRRVVFGFQDQRTYHEFWASEDFTTPDLVCAFNPSIQRSSAYNGKDTWPATINCIFKLKTPLVITSYTLSELTSDLLRIQECAKVGYNIICAPRNNSFSSVRPDRNFISDDEAPLLFKNHCVTVVCGV